MRIFFTPPAGAPVLGWTPVGQDFVRRATPVAASPALAYDPAIEQWAVPGPGAGTETPDYVLRPAGRVADFKALFWDSATENYAPRLLWGSSLPSDLRRARPVAEHPALAWDSAREGDAPVLQWAVRAPEALRRPRPVADFPALAWDSSTEPLAAVLGWGSVGPDALRRARAVVDQPFLAWDSARESDAPLLWPSVVLPGGMLALARRLVDHPALFEPTAPEPWAVPYGWASFDQPGPGRHRPRADGRQPDVLFFSGSVFPDESWQPRLDDRPGLRPRWPASPALAWASATENLVTALGWGSTLPELLRRARAVAEGASAWVPTVVVAPFLGPLTATNDLVRAAGRRLAEYPPLAFTAPLEGLAPVLWPSVALPWETLRRARGPAEYPAVAWPLPDENLGPVLWASIAAEAGLPRAARRAADYPASAGPLPLEGLPPVLWPSVALTVDPPRLARRLAEYPAVAWPVPVENLGPVLLWSNVPDADVPRRARRVAEFPASAWTGPVEQLPPILWASVASADLTRLRRPPVPAELGLALNLPPPAPVSFWWGVLPSGQLVRVRPVPEYPFLAWDSAVVFAGRTRIYLLPPVTMARTVVAAATVRRTWIVPIGWPPERGE